MWKYVLRRHEFYVAVTIFLLSMLIGYVDGSYLTVGNLFDLMRSSIVLGLLSLAAFIVLLSGGIDVSFASIAAASMYITVRYLKYYNYEGNVLLPLLVAAGVGICLGLFNAVFTVGFNLSTLIVTLGTLTMFRGGLIAFVGNKIYNQILPGMVDFSRMNLMTAKQGRLTYGLPASFLILAIAAVVTWLIIQYTQTGRGIAAIGGNTDAARRVGFNIPLIRTFVFAYAGLLAGVAGLLQSTLIRRASPFVLEGAEFGVLAAVVLGGASISGGRGSVLGVMLGVAMITIINNSLILLGISSYWQQAVIGLLILVSVGATKYREGTGAIEMSQV